MAKAEIDQVTSIEVPGLTNFEIIGKGGSSTVFKAVEAELDRLVAVKVLTGISSQKVMRRFDAERKTMGRLSSHDGVVQVHYTGVTNGGYPYIVMPLHDEGSLRDTIRRGPLQWEKAVGYILSAAATIADAHSHGILHLDLKPENLMLAGAGVKVADFGIARSVYDQANQQSADSPGGNIEDPKVTTYLTPAYAPPEAFTNQQTSVQTDIYGLGVTLWTLIGGRTPFEKANADNSADAIAVRAVSDPVGSLRHLAPDAVCRVIEQAMAKQPQDRHQNVEGFIVHLRTALEGQSPIDNQVDSTTSAPAAPQEPSGSQEYSTTPYIGTTAEKALQNLGPSTMEYAQADTQNVETDPSEDPLISTELPGERRKLSATFAYVLGIVTTFVIGALAVSAFLDRGEESTDSADSDSIDVVGTEIEKIETTSTTSSTVSSSQTSTDEKSDSTTTEEASNATSSTAVGQASEDSAANDVADNNVASDNDANDEVANGAVANDEVANDNQATANNQATNNDETTTNDEADDSSGSIAGPQPTTSTTSRPDVVNNTTATTSSTTTTEGEVAVGVQLPISTDDTRGGLLTNYNSLSQPTFNAAAIKTGSIPLAPAQQGVAVPDGTVKTFKVWAAGRVAQSAVDQLKVQVNNGGITVIAGGSFSPNQARTYINGSYVSEISGNSAGNSRLGIRNMLLQRARAGNSDYSTPLVVCREMFDETTTYNDVTDEYTRKTNNLAVVCAEVYESPPDAPVMTLGEVEDDSSVEVSWQAPAALLTYADYQRQTSSSPSGPWANTVGSSSEETDLDPGECIRVRYISVNYGEWSDPVCHPNSG